MLARRSRIKKLNFLSVHNQPRVEFHMRELRQSDKCRNYRLEVINPLFQARLTRLLALVLSVFR